MKIKHLSTLLLFLIAFNSFGQKIKYDGNKIIYKQYPLKPLPKHFKKYSISHVGFYYKLLPGNPKFINHTGEKNKSFSLNYYEKVNKDEDFKIKVIFAPIEVEVKTEFSEKGYMALYYVTLDCHAEILDTSNHLIDTIVINRIEKLNYPSTGPYSTKEAALLDAESIKQSIKADLYQKTDMITENIIANKISILNIKFHLKGGYIKDDVELFSAAEKFNKVVLEIDTIRFDGKDKINKEDISTVLLIWEKRSQSLGELNEENEEVYQMIKYNAARAYFLLGNYDKSKELMSDIMKTYNKFSLAKQLGLAHIYNFNDMLNTHERRLKINGLQ